MDNKEGFKEFSQNELANLPFSLRYEWWNEVVKTNWEVLIYANENQVFAIWPFQKRKAGPFKRIVQPHFTPYSGLFVKYPSDQKPSSKIAYENKIAEDLINKLPPFDSFEQNFHLAFNNSLPFIWNGFTDDKRYTYILDLDKDIDALWSNLRENNRRQIKQAKSQLSITEENNAAKLKEAFNETFLIQNKQSPVDDEGIFDRIAHYIEKYNCGKILHAIDGNNNVHAACCVIWDQEQAYYLLGGSYSAYRQSGAMSLLLWEAINIAKALDLQFFNFEGSSIPAIEKYLRGFGGELHSFSRIVKMDSKLYKTAKTILGK